MDHHEWKEQRKKIRKSYYLVSSHVNPLTANLLGQIFFKEGFIPQFATPFSL